MFSACCTVAIYSGVLGMHLMQEGSGPCKILKPFPSPVEIRDLYVVYGSCMHRPATKLNSC